ncbi:hypothetical protein [Halostreptopolyspora alba]|uniref:Uncharacterized protein n=1 Tax=Halostreptopolyspora alba TaxID=2487137 RepID=A0A3N0ECA1_9ACTN|nr:hypothetical protein EFW17_08215 [Nocardiopsaceae bacterium YIM 96095]
MNRKNVVNNTEDIEGVTALDALARRRLLREAFPPGCAVRHVSDWPAEDPGTGEDDDPGELPVVVGYAHSRVSSGVRLIVRSPEGGRWLRDPEGLEPVEPGDPS